MKNKTVSLIFLYLTFSIILPLEHNLIQEEFLAIISQEDSKMGNWSEFASEMYLKDVIINASDYSGANDTERLQAALDAVPPEGGIVLISGVWTACALVARSNTTIIGVDGVIQRPDNTTCPFISFEGRANFAILGLTFDGRGINNAIGIYISNSHCFTIRNNTFLNITRNAVEIRISTEGFSKDFFIEDNLFINCDDAPILVFGCPSKRNIQNFIILNNTITNGNNNGKIAVAFSSEGFIINNTVINSQHGIATRCVSNLTIKGNVIMNIKDYGIYLGTQIGDNGTDNVIVEDNLVINASIGIARYYGSYPITNILVKNNRFFNSSFCDILADFAALYLNNTITSAEKLVIKDINAVFIETRSITNFMILPGDINYDLKIDIADVAFVAISFGNVEGSMGWKSKADIIRDGVIDIKDVVYVAKNYGTII